MDHVDHLLRCIELARDARAAGNTPFGSLLVGPDGDVLLEQGNVEIAESDCTGHAETALMRAATKAYERDFLSGCTLYSSAEPCAMCSGAIYWGNVRRVVFAIGEAQLRTLTGDDPRNPTLRLPSREVFAAGSRPIEVIGPVDEVVAAGVAVHEGYWDGDRA